jgi:beta-lactamase regulating signal transducer with metallopeptidase domain
MTSAFGLHAIAQSAAVQIVDCLVEGTLIAIFVGLLLAVARRQDSGARFAVWFSALMAIATLPWLGDSWGPQVRGVAAEITRRPALTLPASWALYAAGAWAAIAAWFLLGVGRGLWALQVLRKSCRPVDAAKLDPRLRETVERYQSSRRVTLCTSNEVRVPTAIGFIKPAIVVPAWVMRELSTDELNQILLHELAHLRRRDDWTNLAQKVVKALFFFHPAVWWIEKKVSLEREMACDDAVIAETASPRAYAECLTRLAEQTLLQRGVALAQAAVGRIHQTSLRLAQILDVNRPATAGRSWKPAVSLVAGFAMVCVLGVSKTPKLIAFRDSQPISAASPMIAAAAPILGSGSSATGMSVASLPASRVVFQRQPVRVVPASVKARAVPRASERYVHSAATQSPSVRPDASGMVRDTNVRLANPEVTPAAFTETFLLTVEGSYDGSSDQPVYRIQLWRVIVLHPVIDPNSNRIPVKQT